MEKGKFVENSLHKIKQKASQYFEAWNNHDLETLRQMFANDVELHDWEISVSGLENVISANKKIFDDCPDILVTMKISVCNHNIIFAELVVHLDATETINVVDVIEFDHDLRIKAIRAYKR